MIATKIKDIDAYLAIQPANVRAILEKLRQTIKRTVPDAVEVISYRMPAFKYHGMLAYFAAFKNHYSLFVSPNVLEVFKKDLQQYELSKATIKFPIGKIFPIQLVKKIIKYSAERNLKKVQLNQKRKK